MGDDENIDKIEIPVSAKEEWSRAQVKVTDIILDVENPRLDLKPTATQAEVREILFKQAKVMDLIETILDYRGLYPGEDIIVLREKDKFRVLEGNRRICAIQCILNPQLAPLEFQGYVKELVENSDINPKTLETINVVVSPNWESAQPIITARHSRYKIEKWSYISKWRRDYKQFMISKQNVDEVCRILGEEKSEVIKNLKNYSYLRYARELQVWNSEERKFLFSDDLEGSVLERHMSSTKLQEILGIEFDSDFNLKIKIDPEKFNYVFERLIRSMYFSGKPPIDNRTPKDKVISSVQRWLEEYDNKNLNKDPNTAVTAPPPTSPPPRVGPQRGKPEKYFKSLYKDLKVNDQRLIRLTYELANNNMEDRPISGILLTRALIESALLFRIDRWGLTDDLKRKYKKDVNFIDLKDVLSFCIENAEKLFQNSHEAKKVLEEIQKYREYMNSIVHGSWMDPTAKDIAQIAGRTRELLRTILSDSP